MKYFIKLSTMIALLLFSLVVITGIAIAAPKKVEPEIPLSDVGKTLETKYADMQKTLQRQLEAALPKTDDTKVTAWLDAIKAEEIAAKESGAKAGTVKNIKRTLDSLTKKQEEAKAAPMTYAEAKDLLAEIRAKGEDDPNLAKELESEQTYLANLKNKQKQQQLQIEKATKAATDAEAKLPEAIKASEVAEQANQKAMAATWQAMDALGMNGVLGSNQLDGKLVQYMVIKGASPRGLAQFAEKSPDNEKLIEELFRNEALMIQMLVADGPNSGKFGEAMKIYSDIQKASSKAKEGIFQRLAVAVSLSHALPIRVSGATCGDGEDEEDDSSATSQFIDPVQRYLSYEEWHLAGELDPGFKDLSVWNLALVVDGREPDEIFAWGREMLRNLRPDCIPSDGNTSTYVDVVDKEIAYTSAMMKDDLPELASMQNILANGGICGRRAFFGRFTLRAYGIPATARKQPGHATLAHWHPDGWKTKLGGGWGLGARGRYSYMNETRSKPYGVDLNFLTSSQAREDATAFMKVKRAQWIGAMVGEKPRPGLIIEAKKISPKEAARLAKNPPKPEKPLFWNELALQEQRRIIAGLESGKSKSSSATSVAATAHSATGTITVDAKGVITIPSAACSNPTERTHKLARGGDKDLVVFVKDHKSGETRLHYSRYALETDTFEYAFDAPKAGKYKLEADVVVPKPNQVLFASANGGADVKIELPYTIGLRQAMQSVEIELASGKNVLKFHGPARVTIGQFILTPTGN